MRPKSRFHISSNEETDIENRNKKDVDQSSLHAKTYVKSTKMKVWNYDEKRINNKIQFLGGFFLN